jgi:hypothetical protein
MPLPSQSSRFYHPHDIAHHSHYVRKFFGLIQLRENGRHRQSTNSFDFSKAISRWSSPLCTLVHLTELNPHGFNVWLSNVFHLARTMMYVSMVTTIVMSILRSQKSCSQLHPYADIHNLCFACLFDAN